MKKNKTVKLEALSRLPLVGPGLLFTAWQPKTDKLLKSERFHTSEVGHF